MITTRSRKIAALLLTLAVTGCSTTRDGPTATEPEETVLSISTRNPALDAPYNLNVLLRNSNRIEGLILFRQPDDGTTTVYLDTYLAHLTPNHDYYLERAAQTLGLGCVDAAWLRLGLGTVVTPIHTNWNGFGNATLNRTLPTTLIGTSFDIHFHIVDAATGVVVMDSGCYQYKVRAT
jgi:hypothetical protein